MRKLLYVLFILCLLVGCSSNTEEPEELVLRENELYSAPITQNELTITHYNALTDAITNNDEMEIVKNIAKTFAADFFTFKTKTGEDHMGGMTYFLQEKRMSAKAYLKFYYYKNYTPIVNQYGEEALPEVIEIIAVDPIATTFEENDYGTLEAYDVRLDISYAETTIPTSALKTETVITIAKYPEGFFIVEIK
ncbi:MAG: hypothetical protein IKM20_02620 [Erysipelotrichales bacterium]|nr:hypothetical protein [Erysipelotrichales bacterium]